MSRLIPGGAFLEMRAAIRSNFGWHVQRRQRRERRFGELANAVCPDDRLADGVAPREVYDRFEFRSVQGRQHLDDARVTAAFTAGQLEPGRGNAIDVPQHKADGRVADSFL
jgi:hypothetical protein